LNAVNLCRPKEGFVGAEEKLQTIESCFEPPTEKHSTVTVKGNEKFTEGYRFRHEVVNGFLKWRGFLGEGRKIEWLEFTTLTQSLLE
jgi:hypothetical protein